MKIAYFLDTITGVGGAGNLLLQQANLMSKLHSVIVVIPVDNNKNYNIEYARRCEQYQIKYVCLQYNTTFDFSFIDFEEAMYNVKYIEKFAVKEHISFFHSVQLNLSVEYVARKLKIPHLMDIYQLREEEFKICPGDIYAHFHLCDSILYAKRWSQQLNIESRCVRPVALSNKMRKKDSYAYKKIKILMLGSVCIRKQQLEAIKAVENCVNIFDMELHIAGDLNSNYGNICKQYVEEHNLKKIVFFHGFISNIIPILKESDCLLCSSIDESFPSSIIEALTYDLTIVSTPVAGVPELFVDKYNSFISKDFSWESISKSISECLLYYKNGQIQNIHKNAEETWLKNFDRKVIRESIEKYYQDIVNNNKFYELSCFEEIEKSVDLIKEQLKNLDDNGEKWIWKRSLYYIAIKKYLHTGKVYIWGAGVRGKLTFKILRKICPNVQIMAFIDITKKGRCCGLPIIKLEDVSIDEDDFYCISFAAGSEFAIQYLERYGLCLYKQIWYMP